MNAIHQKLIRVALICGVLCYLIFIVGSTLAWELFPDRHSDDSFTQQVKWSVHILAEKVGGVILMSLAAFFAARSHRPTWKVGVNTAIATSVIFQSISTIVYLLRFGLSAYLAYNDFIYTITSAVALGWLFGFLAVWKQYRRERHATIC